MPRSAAYGVSPKLTSELSSREIQVLCLIADGFQNKKVAQKLGLTPKTVEFHKTWLYTKIGASGVAGAVRFAIREGYIDA